MGIIRLRSKIIICLLVGHLVVPFNAQAEDEPVLECFKIAGFEKQLACTKKYWRIKQIDYQAQKLQLQNILNRNERKMLDRMDKAWQEFIVAKCDMNLIGKYRDKTSVYTCRIGFTEEQIHFMRYHYYCKDSPTTCSTK